MFSVTTGRQLITEQLGHLKWHQDIGYISADRTSSFCADAQNLVGLMDQPIDQETLESFFIQQFYCDFLWIEATPDLLSMPWIYAFKEQILNYRLDSMIPIIILGYQKTL